MCIFQFWGMFQTHSAYSVIDGIQLDELDYGGSSEASEIATLIIYHYAHIWSFYCGKDYTHSFIKYQIIWVTSPYFVVDIHSWLNIQTLTCLVWCLSSVWIGEPDFCHLWMCPRIFVLLYISDAGIYTKIVRPSYRYDVHNWQAICDSC